MPRLPALSGAEMIKVLEQKGYSQVRTRGSHVRLYPPDYLPEAKKVTPASQTTQSWYAFGHYERRGSDS